MKCKIKQNASISQDMRYGVWPFRDINDLDIIFSVERSGHLWICKAHGFGDEDDYGNGSIFVSDLHGIEFVGAF